MKRVVIQCSCQKAIFFSVSIPYIGKNLLPHQIRFEIQKLRNLLFPEGHHPLFVAYEDGPHLLQLLKEFLHNRRTKGVIQCGGPRGAKE